MKLLVIRGDLQSHSGYSAAARAYCGLLAEFFDRIVGVDIHHSPDRPCQRFPYPLLAEADARRLAADAPRALVLSFTTPDCYARYSGALNVGLTFWETDRLPLTGQGSSAWVAKANAQDALWVPSTHTRNVFAEAGVTVPITVIPWPIAPPMPAAERLPKGEVFDLDRSPWLAESLVRCARFQGNRFRWSRQLMQHVRPPLARYLLSRLRTESTAIPEPAEQALLCVAQDVPRKGLLLFLSEWLEFKRQAEAAAWSLILKTSPIDPQTPAFDFVVRFWEHVQALKRQLRVRQARVYLWTGTLDGPDFNGLLANTHGYVAPSLGEGFCGPAALAMSLGKPLVAPRHTAFADYLAPEHPYTYATRPAIVSFVRDPLRVYDPASMWQVPLPFSLAGALTRLARDTPARRAEAGRRAGASLTRWCGPERVRRLLAEELDRRLAVGYRLTA